MASSIVARPGRPAVLVDDDGHVRVAAAHLAEELLRPLELGDEEGRIDVLRQRERLLVGVGEIEEVLGVEDADDVVDGAAVDRQARELLLPQQHAHGGEGGRLGQGHDLRARDHDVADGLVPELDDLVEQALLLPVDDALVGAEVEDALELLLRQARPG